MKMQTRTEIIEQAIIASLQYERWDNGIQAWIQEIWQISLFCVGIFLGLVWSEQMGPPILEYFDDATGPWWTDYEYSGYDDEPPNEIEWYGHPWLPIVMVAEW